MRRSWLAAIMLVLISAGAFAQTETGQISGTVTDSTGALVSGAKVTIKSVNTGFTREAVTNASGLYTIPSLRPDTYGVSIEAKGFQNYARRVEVAVGSLNEVSAQLVVGAASTTVEVSALNESVTVNTESQTLSQIVTADDLKNLPTDPNRNLYALVGTSANVSVDMNSGRGTGFDQRSTVGFDQYSARWGRECGSVYGLPWAKSTARLAAGIQRYDQQLYG